MDKKIRIRGVQQLSAFFRAGQRRHTCTGDSTRTLSTGSFEAEDRNGFYDPLEAHRARRLYKDNGGQKH